MNEREQLAKDNGMTIEFVNWFFDNKKDGCGNVWFMMMAAMWEGWSGREAKCAALAAENAALKSDVPMGAIENGRVFADRLEAYRFECEGGNLNMCSDWQELRRCFEHLSEWAMHGQSETSTTNAFLAEVLAQGVDSAAGAIMVHMNHQHAAVAEALHILRTHAAQLRQEAAQ